MALPSNFKTSQFETHVENYSVREFFDIYRKKFPVIAIVTQGNLGMTDFETFSSEQVLYCHNSTTQRRVVARDSRGRIISIPEDYPWKFRYVISKNKVEEPASLREILSKHKVPMQVQFAKPREVSFYIGNDYEKAEYLSNLAVSQVYEESFIVANGVNHGKFDKACILVPLYLKDLLVAVVTGVKKFPTREWNLFLDAVKQDMKDVTFDPNAGNKDIAVFSEDVLLDDDHIYAYIEPTRYIRYSELSQGGGQDNSPYSLPYFHVIKRPSEKPKDKHGPPVPPIDKARPPIKDVQRSLSIEPPPPLPPRSFKRSYTCPASVGQIAPHLKDLSVEGFARVLKDLKLGKHSSKFRKNGVDGVLAANLTEEIIKGEFGLTGFEAIKLMRYITTGHIPT